MVELFREYLPLLVAALAIGLVTGWLIWRPRQRVRLGAATPLRPHMAQHGDGGEGNGIADELAAATSDIAGELLGVPVHSSLPGAGQPDDLQRLKGIGPRLCAILNQRGITRFDQLAALSDAELEQLDQGLGNFRGRLARDQIAVQADFLARGDTEGFERRFGKL